MPDPYRISTFRYPLSSGQVAQLNDTIEDIYRNLRGGALDVTVAFDDADFEHPLLDSTHHLDTTTGTPVTGDIITAQANLWARLAKGADGQFLKIASSAPGWANLAASDIASGALTTARGGTSVDIASAALPLGSGQITFPAVQNASASANTLDDYEEGTWTPAVQFGGASVGVTYVAAEGRYVKIGDFVSITGGMFLSSKGSSVGAAVITGVPFAPQNSNKDYSSNGPYFTGFAAGVTGIVEYVQPGTINILQYKVAAGGVVAMADTDYTNASVVLFSHSFMTT